MTYCFAWKYQDAVCLIADTLVTQCVPADADRPTTSTGEPHRQLRATEFVQERQLKFRELKQGVAVAFAGNVQLALAITDFMQDNIGSVKNPADLFQKVEASFGPFDSARVVQMLLVQGMENGECAITKWDSRSGGQDAAQSAHIGSLASGRADWMADRFQRLVARQTMSKEAMLLAGMVFVMSLSRHEDLIRENVGGVVCGLWVQRGKTLWPDDLVVVCHHGLASIKGKISIHAREGSVYINSTYLGTTSSLFINIHSGVPTADIKQAWDKQWFPYLKDYLQTHFLDCTRWLFINLDREAPVVFIVHGPLKDVSDTLRFEPIEGSGGGYVLKVDSYLGKALKDKASGWELRVVEGWKTGAPPDGMVVKGQ